MDDPDLDSTDAAILASDVIGSRNAGQRNVKRNAVQIDGFSSDSEPENFDARADAKARRKRDEDNEKKKSRLEEENDMFADLADDFADEDDEGGDEGTGAKRKKKAVRFLNEDEIEGQDETSRAGAKVRAEFLSGQNGIREHKGKGPVKRHHSGEGDASSSESEVDDETRAAVEEGMDAEVGAGSKKQYAPKVDAFNMRSENEEGRFDESGNYVRNAADPDAVHDNWLDGLSKKDMKQAKEAEDQREIERRKRNAEDDAVLTSDLLRTLITQLHRGETLLEALARIGKSKEKKIPRQARNKNRRRGDDTGNIEVSMSDNASTDSAEMQRKAAVETITDAADRLLGRGEPEIYDTEREMLIRHWQRETGEQWRDTDLTDSQNNGSAVRMWDYRWSDARDGGESHGPYDTATMKQWNDAGYFGEGVEFRERAAGSEWDRVVDFA